MRRLHQIATLQALLIESLLCIDLLSTGNTLDCVQSQCLVLGGSAIDSTMGGAEEADTQWSLTFLLIARGRPHLLRGGSAAHFHYQISHVRRETSRQHNHDMHNLEAACLKLPPGASGTGCRSS